MCSGRPKLEIVSKAFLPEDAAAPAAPLLPTRPARPQPITPAGQRRLQEERARLLGSSAEADKARLAFLERVLGTVQVIDPTLVRGGAGFGCTIELEGPDGETRRFVLVGPDEVDAPAGRITADTPAGRALLGCRVGDMVALPRGGKRVEMTVVDVRASEA
jgi:transcription elongation GreA/GreB family factor